MYVRHELLHYRLSSRKFMEYIIKIQEDNLKINIHVVNITRDAEICSLYRKLNIISVLESKSSNWDENIKTKSAYIKL
jgi:hypothetical protein